MKSTSRKLRVLGCDHLGLPRGKYLPPRKIAEGETRLCQGVYALTYDKDLVPAPGSKMLEGLPDMLAKYDVKDIRQGWQDDDVVVADFCEVDGTPHGVCGRSALKRAIKQWEALGYTPKIGIELEGYAFVKNDDGMWEPYETPAGYVYNTGPMADPLGFTDAIWDCADRLGFQLEMLTTEFDEPQFEFTLTFDDALKAIDDMFLFKLMAREVALEKGVYFTFMPKPIEGLSGSGLHINFSLFDQAGNNVIGDANNEHGLSELGKACVAGMMEHHKGLAALVAPTVNSYRRLQPASLSGYWKNWAVDHRGVTIRVADEQGKYARIEHRMADAAASPYVAVAAVLQAARLGHVNQYPLPAAETGDCLENSDASEGIAENLADALVDLQADTALVAEIGEELVGNLVAIKTAEIANLGNGSELEYYIQYI